MVGAKGREPLPDRPRDGQLLRQFREERTEDRGTFSKLPSPCEGELIKGTRIFFQLFVYIYTVYYFAPTGIGHAWHQDEMTGELRSLPFLTDPKMIREETGKCFLIDKP